MDDDEVETGISRRSALKRIGVGAAVAWTAPVIMSVGDRAFGAAPPGSAHPCTGCTPCVGGQQPQCGSDANGLCYCVPTRTGACTCVGGSNNVETHCRTSCANNATCPSGTICVQTCCDVYFTGATSLACFPAC